MDADAVSWDRIDGYVVDISSWSKGVEGAGGYVVDISLWGKGVEGSACFLIGRPRETWTAGSDETLTTGRDRLNHGTFPEVSIP